MLLILQNLLALIFYQKYDMVMDQWLRVHTALREDLSLVSAPILAGFQLPVSRGS